MWFVCITIVMAKINIQEVWELYFDEILVIHMTVGLLSHNFPRNNLLIVGAAHIINLIAITSCTSSRPEFVMLPLGLYWDTETLLIYYRSFTLNTNGHIFIHKDNHTTPDHYDTSFCYPMNFRGSGKIYLMCVIRITNIYRSLQRYLNACTTSNIFPSTTVWGFNFINLFIVVKKPFNYGIIRAYWRRFPTAPETFELYHFIPQQLSGFWYIRFKLIHIQSTCLVYTI